VPVYAEFHRWLGRDDRLAGMWKAWEEGDRKAALDAIPDSVVDELIVWGHPDKCHETLQRYIANGITTLALAPLPFGYDVREAVRDLAPR
jgi:alkanesulfonate monooxygenase SsuD/methylene tetrahydromethanopterin reductase-like flavin-dependent oxidoreductase (luciferase family)